MPTWTHSLPTFGPTIGVCGPTKRRQPLHSRRNWAPTFDTLFGRHTGYADLDDRIAKTRAKRQALLCVLEKPYLPLHNNPAELAARRRVRKRDVSVGARSPTGIHAWDVFHTLVGTACLLGVNVLHYFQDRRARACHIPLLADLIRQRTAQAAAVLPAAA